MAYHGRASLIKRVFCSVFALNLILSRPASLAGNAEALNTKCLTFFPGRSADTMLTEAAEFLLFGHYGVFRNSRDSTSSPYKSRQHTVSDIVREEFARFLYHK